MRTPAAFVMALVLSVAAAGAAELPAVVHKPAVDVYQQPSFDAAKIASLQRNTTVRIAAQQGLWYQLHLPTDASGYVRVNDVRMAYAAKESGDANVRVLMGGKAGSPAPRGLIARGLRRAGWRNCEACEQCLLG